MAGGTINRVSLGSSIKEIEENFTVYTENFTMNSGGKGYFSSDKEILIANPKQPKPVGRYFKRGWWTDENDKSIKEALVGQKVKFHIEMDKSKVPAGSKINFTLKDWDGLFNHDDSIKIYSSQKDAKTNIYLQVEEMQTDANGKACIWINLTENLVTLINDDGGNEIELYFACTYYDKSDKETEQLDLPVEEFNYLVVYEKEFLITVLIELPHSYYTLLNNPISALGLAGHSAMAIGDRYFDYGPDYSQSTVNEKQYDYDFNDDGDKVDNVDLKAKDKNGKPIYNINEKFSPGRPWWGEMVADRLEIKASDVKLDQVLDFIKLDWKKFKTGVYGEVYKTDFYVKESEAKRMIKWWEERYKHLKVYSVYPWTGEQCTTAVKAAIQEAFPFGVTKPLGNFIPDTTQMPSGLLEDLRSFKSTSKQHNEQLAKQIIIKPESKNFP
ncbi:hypothetical protein [Chryseobacterium sp. JUb7]|uniref:hypothetical protein n=1 Tax=Chryseobacterium sp. JUb7 TaxID=2940599 RepID=UPI002169AC05|nr:hypothetical protein [Chryseobacterium sp. JUb7]MCS3532770.1 hypothetical protein [Chryseobacterium sp. JUb7]